MAILPSKPRRKQIIALGLPIIGGMASQNVLNVVDTAMVGTLGDIALAGEVLDAEVRVARLGPVVLDRERHRAAVSAVKAVAQGG